MEPNTAKTLGGIGSALTFLITIAAFASELAFVLSDLEVIYELISRTVVMMIWLFISALLYLVGPILMLFGLRGLGDYYNDEGIKRNSLRWFIWWALVVAAGMMTCAIVGPLPSTSNVTTSTPFAADTASFSAIAIFTIISAVYLKRTYAALTARTGVGLFNTAGKLYWWGSLFYVRRSFSLRG